jgi:parallel beta-helix repeat protein
MRTYATLIGLLALPLLALAGPLDPPAGPIAPTPGPEPRTAINATNTPGDADSLYKITQPGSYYLAGNVTGEVGKHGIEIVASGVTIDLNGFDMVGVPAMGLFDGITATALNLTNITIVNGSLRDWGDEGIDFRNFGASGGVVERVVASGNAGDGISVGSGSTVANCTAYRNIRTGIFANGGGTIINCSAFDNFLSGISANNGTTIFACTVSNNDAIGIEAGSGCSVANCTAFANGAEGIVATTGTTITNCSVRTNTLDGIRAFSDCTISGNLCAGNGNGTANDGAGIRVTSTDNRIEGNNCTDADRGIDVDGVGNIIIRNTCTGNTVNWAIVANNVYGPIIDRTAPNSAAVSGNAAASTLGSTDPNANFSY